MALKQKKYQRTVWALTTTRGRVIGMVLGGCPFGWRVVARPRKSKLRCVRGVATVTLPVKKAS